MYPSQQHIINGFTDTLGLPRFDPASTEPHRLYIDQRWLLQISYSDHHLILFSFVGKLPQENLTPSPSSTLTETISWTRLHDTHAHIVSHLGRDPLQGLVILHASAEITNLDSASFQQWVQEFMTQLSQWSSLIDQQNPTSGSIDHHTTPHHTATSSTMHLTDLISLA